jgi:hypothetical protein
MTHWQWPPGCGDPAVSPSAAAAAEPVGAAVPSAIYRQRHAGAGIIYFPQQVVNVYVEYDAR